MIFLRHYKLRSGEKESSYDNFQVEACSRCGICIDPCQLQRVLQIDRVQSVYFLRDRRYGMLDREVADNCLMCGRCAERCPVGIDLNTLPRPGNGRRSPPSPKSAGRSGAER